MSKSEINNCSIQILDPDPRVTKRSFCVKKEEEEEVFSLVLVQTRIFYCVIRIEETKYVPFQGNVFPVEKHNFLAWGGPKTVLKLS